MMFGEYTEEAGLPVCADDSSPGKMANGGNGMSASTLRNLLAAKVDMIEFDLQINNKAN